MIEVSLFNPNFMCAFAQIALVLCFKRLQLGGDFNRFKDPPWLPQNCWASPEILQLLAS